MSENLTKVRSGDPLRIPAATFNAFIDAAVAERQRRHDQTANSLAALLRPILVPVRNDSGSDVERFGVLGIDAVIVTADDNLKAFQNQVTLTGTLPDPDVHSRRFVVTHDPIAAGKMGTAYVVGVCPGKVDVVAEDHVFADVAADQLQYLASRADGGADILWKQSGTGVKWAIIRLPQQRSSSSGQVFKLVGGPDVNNLYTALKQRVTDFGTYEDVDDTPYKVLFQGVSGQLPGAGTGERLNGKYVYAVSHGTNGSGAPIWEAHHGLPGVLDLVEDPTEQ